MIMANNPFTTEIDKQYKLRFLFIGGPILWHTTELLPLSLFKIVKLPPSSLSFLYVPHPHCIILNTTNHHLRDHICYLYLLSIPPWIEYKLHKGRDFWQFVLCCISSIQYMLKAFYKMNKTQHMKTESWSCLRFISPDDRESRETISLRVCPLIPEYLKSMLRLSCLIKLSRNPHHPPFWGDW